MLEMTGIPILLLRILLHHLPLLDQKLHSGLFIALGPPTTPWGIGLTSGHRPLALHDLKIGHQGSDIPVAIKAEVR